MDWDEMRQLGEMRSDGTFELSVPLPTTPTGKVRRCCPNPDCRPGLSLLGDGPEAIPGRLPGMRRVPQSARMTCPYCGTDAEDDDWLCPEDLEHVLDQVGWAAERDTAKELQRMAQDFNRKVGGGLLGISMEVEGVSRSRPRAWIEDLLRELACDRCGREYGVYAIGLFCPDCGTRILHGSENPDEPISVKAGSLDDTSWLDPGAHIWWRSAQPWVAIDRDHYRCFDREPEDENALRKRWQSQNPMN